MTLLGDLTCLRGSKNVFDAVVAELSGQRAAMLTHAQLEELVAARGRELLRQLLQDHLDLRAAREEQAVALLHQASHGEVAGADGVVRRRTEAGHHRLLATIFGTVTVRRCAFREITSRGNRKPANTEALHAVTGPVPSHPRSANATAPYGLLGWCSAYRPALGRRAAVAAGS
jgi:hypothetical protein